MFKRRGKWQMFTSWNINFLQIGYILEKRQVTADKNMDTELINNYNCVKIMTKILRPWKCFIFYCPLEPMDQKPMISLINHVSNATEWLPIF